MNLIVAIAQNYAIGNGNDLLWHLSADLKRFKALTTGHSVIMGRKTFESLPIRPLPNRKNIIITRSENSLFEGCETAHTLEEALQLCADDSDAFVMGGGEIYRQFLPIVDTLYITWVYRDFEADTFFPEIDSNIWEVCEQSERFTDEKTGLDYAFYTYKRKT